MFRKVATIGNLNRIAKHNVAFSKPQQFARFSTTEVPPPAEEQKPQETVVDPLVAKDLQIATLQKEVKDLKDKVLRAYAEEENVRRIARKDVESARTYANTSFAKAMLDISDNLERALDVVSPEHHNTSKDPTLKALVEGIQMTEKSLQKVFGQFGVVKYGAINDVFDPSLHDALFQLPAEENKPAGTIGQVLKTGYKLKDRVIRAAEVGTRVNSDL